MQLVFPDDEAVQPHLKLLAMAKRWKKGTETTSTQETTDHHSSTKMAMTKEPVEDDLPLPEARIDDEEMNDES